MIWESSKLDNYSCLVSNVHVVTPSSQFTKQELWSPNIDHFPMAYCDTMPGSLCAVLEWGPSLKQAVLSHTCRKCHDASKILNISCSILRHHMYVLYAVYTVLYTCICLYIYIMSMYMSMHIILYVYVYVYTLYCTYVCIQ